MEEFQHLIINDTKDGVKFYENVVEKGNEQGIEEVSKVFAEVVRGASFVKRVCILQNLLKCSILCRMYISHQFRSINDTSLWRYKLFENDVEFESLLMIPIREYTTAIGQNSFFNLGVFSDGSPVEEWKLVDIPGMKQIKMSNHHSVFLSRQNAVYGCGRSSNILKDDVNWNKKTGKYITTPVLLSIPEKMNVKSIDVGNEGTRIIGAEKDYQIGDFKPCIEVDHENKRVFEVVIPMGKEMVRIFVSENGLHWGIKKNELNNCATWYIDGEEHTNLSNDQQAEVLSDGTIYINYVQLYKGKFEFWKVKDEGFVTQTGHHHKKVKNGSDKFNNHDLVVVMEGVPTTGMVTQMAMSPDGKNSIIQYGCFMLSPTKCLKEAYHSIITNFDDRYRYKSEDHFQIMTSRLEDQDLTELDIPMDLIVRVELPGETVEIPTNRIIFEMCYPFAAHRIQQDSSILLDFRDESYYYLILFILVFQRNDRLIPLLSVENEDVVEVFKSEFQGIQPVCIREACPTTANTDQFFLKLEAPITNFVPPGTRNEDIYHIKSVDGQVIPCHRYLLQLHSRQISAFTRFNTCYSAFGTFEMEKDEDNEPFEIKCEMKGNIIRRAIKGLVDISTLFHLKMNEIIEVLFFYDFYMMHEAFDDTFQIIFASINDFNIEYVFELYHSFENKVLDGFLKKPYLLIHQCSPSLPPRKLIERFSEEMIKSQTKPPKKLKFDVSRFDKDFVLSRLFDKNVDVESDVWRMLEKGSGQSYQTYIEEQKDRIRKKEMEKVKKEENIRRARMNSENNGIPIPGARKLKNSISESPSFQSPDASRIRTISTTSIHNNVMPGSPVCNSFEEDFPESGNSLSTPLSKGKSTGGRFIPKGAKFKKANEILKSPAAGNPWNRNRTISEDEPSTSSMFSAQSPTSVSFLNVVEEEKKFVKTLKGENKTMHSLAFVEMEQNAGEEIERSIRLEIENDALVTIEIVEFEGVIDQPLWGMMQGRVFN